MSWQSGLQWIVFRYFHLTYGIFRLAQTQMAFSKMVSFLNFNLVKPIVRNLKAQIMLK